MGRFPAFPSFLACVSVAPPKSLLSSLGGLHGTGLATLLFAVSAADTFSVSGFPIFCTACLNRRLRVTRACPKHIHSAYGTDRLPFSSTCDKPPRPGGVPPLRFLFAVLLCSPCAPT